MLVACVTPFLYGGEVNTRQGGLVLLCAQQFFQWLFLVRAIYEIT